MAVVINEVVAEVEPEGERRGNEPQPTATPVQEQKPRKLRDAREEQRRLEQRRARLSAD